MKIKTGQYAGTSSACIKEAIQDALSQAHDDSIVEVVEALSRQIGKDKRYYKVLVNTYERSILS